MKEAKPQGPSMFRRIAGALLNLLAISKAQKSERISGELEKLLAWKPKRGAAPKPMRHARIRMRGNWRARRAVRMAMQKESRRTNRRQTSRNWA